MFYSPFLIVLFALVANKYTVICDHDDVDTLSKKLFDKDAPVLPKEEVLKLLEQIEPLIAEISDDKNEIVREDVDYLIRAGQENEYICMNSAGDFFEKFPTERRMIKSKSDENWNKNIQNYVDECLMKQLTNCFNKFVSDIDSKLNLEQLELMKTFKNKLNGICEDDKRTVHVAKEMIKAALPKRKHFHLGPSKKSNLNAIENEYDKMNSICTKILQTYGWDLLMSAVNLGYVDREGSSMKDDEKLHDYHDYSNICLGFPKKRGQFISELTNDI